MFFIWLGCVIFSICALVGEYLLIRLAVRDGIDSSSTTDWKETYALEQERSKEPLPSLKSMYKEAGESNIVTALPVNQRKDEIERIVARRARNVVRDARRKRVTLTIVGIIAGAVVSALMIFGGLQAAHSTPEKPSYEYTTPSGSSNPFSEYLSQYD